MGPYPIATLALAAFFPFAFYIFKRFPPAMATAISVLAGSIFLPEVASLPELPLIPSLEKEKVTYLGTLFAILAYHRKRFFEARPGTGPEALFLVMLLAFVATISMNMRVVFNEGAIRDGLGMYWFFARSAEDFLVFVVPFIVGRAMFRSVEDLKTLLYWTAASGLIYTVLIGIELLLSVPFYVWQFSQTIYGIPMRPMWRWGIIQPIVFMDNGLSVASYMAVTVVAGAAFVKAKMDLNWRGIKRVRVILLSGLMMTWNVAGIIYGYVLAAALAVVSGKTFARFAMLLVVATCIYPAMRIADVFPDAKLVEIAQGFDNDRARSLKGRFDEEDFVLGQIGERLWVGWGMFDRIPGAASFGDGESGLDSFWIIRAGLTGIIGIEIFFLLLAIPVLTAWRRVKRATDEQLVILMAALMACVAIRMVDLLLNGLWNCLPLFLAGALHGVAKSISTKRPPPGAVKRRKAVRDSTNSG